MHGSRWDPMCGEWKQHFSKRNSMFMDVWNLNFTFSCTPMQMLCCNLFYQYWLFLYFRNGYSFETSLLLSVFLGMFGADRFYLGYPAIGLFKLCTLGCMFLGNTFIQTFNKHLNNINLKIGQIVDIILIATQTVGPADGSHYIINYFGPRLSPLELDNDTYRMPQFDWPELWDCEFLIHTFFFYFFFFYFSCFKHKI